MVQISMLLLTIILMTLYFYSLFYHKKKISEYKNDERWQAVEIKANQIQTRYFQCTLVAFAIGSTMPVLIDSLDGSMPIQRALYLGFCVIVFGQVVSLFALKYFDKRM
mgnify:CR=1 FL=1